MLTPSQKLLLQCLADFLEHRPTKPACPGADWEEVFGTAKAQSLEGILFYQCSPFMPSEVKRKQLKQYLGSAVISIKREEIVRELAEHLAGKEIPVIFIKGSVFRDYYQIPPLRSMGDIDLMIHPEDREETDRILRTEMGFQRFIDNQAVWTYWKGNQYIELHTRMFYDPLANNVNYCAYFDQIWEKCHNAPVFGAASDILFVPDEGLHFLYLIAHTAKHIVNNGSGFRAYLDMAMMCRACKDSLDWEWIADELENLRLLSFTKICFQLCERWFGIKMPLAGEEQDEEFYRTVTEKTFKDGIFGLDNRENRRASAAKEIKRSGSYYPGAFKRVVHKLFPPYDDMQLVPWYSFLDGRSWLLPAAWVYRWFYCLIKKGRHSWALLAEPFTKKREVSDRESYLEKWGL